MAPRPGHGIRHVAAAASAVVLVCRKCSRKLDGGFGRDGDKRLASVLKRAWQRDADGRRSRAPRRALAAVVEVDCLRLCPKQAVVVLRADRPDDWLLVPRGAAVEAIGAALRIGPAGVPEEG